MKNPFIEKYLEMQKETAPGTHKSLSVFFDQASRLAGNLKMVGTLSRHSRHSIRETIDVEATLWAMDLVDQLLADVVNSMGTSMLGHKMLKLIRLKATSERPGLTEREIVRGVRGMDTKLFKEVAESMLQARILRTVDQKANNRNHQTITLYCVADKNRNN